MKKQRLSVNFIYQFLYQGVVLIIPLILSPYLTRTLQETSLGVFSYINSIAYYFIVFANLGILRHGQRIISQRASDELKLRKAFWSLFIIHAIVSLLSMVLYTLFVVAFVRENKIIYYIEIIYVASALFDITWFFYGIENFKSVVIKNAIIKLIYCVLVFFLVKSPSDIWKYTILSSGSILCGQIVMIPQAVKIVKPIKFKYEDAKEHIKPLLLYSISVVAATAYTVFDKTLIGIMLSIENVAFYEYSSKIVNIPKSIVTVVGTVMFPRACRLASENNIEGQNRYINYSFLLTSMIGIGSIFGLLAIAPLFAEIFYGATFSICGYIIMALSPLVYIIGTGDIIRTQYMIPNGMDKQFNFCIILNAIVNLALSILLIRQLGIYGVVIGTVSAEVFGLIYQIVLCKTFIKVKDLYKTSFPFVISGLIMFLLLKKLNSYLKQNMVALLIELAVGAVVYLLLSFISVVRLQPELKGIVRKKIFSSHNK